MLQNVVPLHETTSGQRRVKAPSVSLQRHVPLDELLNGPLGSGETPSSLFLTAELASVRLLLRLLNDHLN